MVFSKAKSMLTTNQTQARLNLRKALEMDPGNIEAHELANQLFGQDIKKMKKYQNLVQTYTVSRFSASLLYGLGNCCWAFTR